MTIKFNLDVKPVWVDGSIEDFDSTEIGDFSKKERIKIRLLLSPLFPGTQRELRQANTHQEFAEDVMVELMRRRKDKSKFKDTPQNRKFIEDILKQANIGVKEVFDDIGYNRDLIDTAILDWEGLLDVNDKKIPCTKENKVKLFYDGGYTAMGLRIVGICSRLATRHDLYQLEKEKNSQSSQDGKQ